MDINKIKSEFMSFEPHINEHLKTLKYEMYLDATIKEFIENGNYEYFFKALYDMFKGERILFLIL